MARLGSQYFMLDSSLLQVAGTDKGVTEVGLEWDDGRVCESLPLCCSRKSAQGCDSLI
jgi:hypothetical protein